MIQWRKVGNNEEEITVKKSEEGKTHVEEMRRAPWLMRAQTQMWKKGTGKGKERKIAGWFTKMLEEINQQRCEDTETKWCSGEASVKRISMDFERSYVTIWRTKSGLVQEWGSKKSELIKDVVSRKLADGQDGTEISISEVERRLLN